MARLDIEPITVTLPERPAESYKIHVGENLFGKLAYDLNDSPIGGRYAIITDSNVEPLYADALQTQLSDMGLTNGVFTFQAGEPNKTIYTCLEIMGQMSQLGYGREDAIIALGGGVVGDMAGFIAATLYRGIPYIQVPTTVLAQADASVGGKTAVDMPYGKNLMGAFYHPKAVYIDTATIATLSHRDYASGLAETIKHGIIRDREFFEYLFGNVNLINERTPEFLLEITQNNCRIKRDVVEIDPGEKGLRRILNYGHTVGHAIENLSVNMYKERQSSSYLLHGEAVAIGMMVAGRIAKILNYFSQEELTRQEQLLLTAGLPTKIPPEFSDSDIIEITSRDKKAKNGQARYVLPTAIGQMCEFNGVYATYVGNKIVEEALRQTR